MKKIAFRADGSPTIGMGHIMRCMSIAQQLQALGNSVYFISRESVGIEKLIASGYKVAALKSAKPQNLKELLDVEIEEVNEILGREGCDALIVDRYNLSNEYFLALKNAAKMVIFIDDLNLFDCSADVIINGNITGPYLNYKKLLKHQQLLLGTTYLPMRSEFSNIEKRLINEKVRSVMITTGGSDEYSVTLKLLDFFIKSGLVYDVVINVIVASGFSKHLLLELDILVSKYLNIKLHTNPTNMAEIMLQADLAISAGGSTLYELCACGTPTMAFVLADNQLGIVERLSAEGFIYYLGWHYELEENKLVKNIKMLAENYVLRCSISEKIQALVDGKGAERIADKITQLI